MDPNATFLRWLTSDDAEERHELACSYNAWIMRGGFRATFNSYEAVDLTAYTVCIACRDLGGREIRKVIRPCTFALPRIVVTVGKAVRS